MIDSQPLGRVICSNHIDYNLILLSLTPHGGPPRMGTSLTDGPFVGIVQCPLIF